MLPIDRTQRILTLKYSPNPPLFWWFRMQWHRWKMREFRA